MDAQKSLKQLLSDWQTAVANTPYHQPPPYDGPDVALTQFTEKTDEVGPGSCFVARVRTGSDGHPWIGKAIENGAAMILGQQAPESLPFSIPNQVVYWQVADTAETLAWLSAAWYGFPSRHLIVVGVTGTNGKTTTVSLIHAILTKAGYKTGMLSTLKAIIGNQEEALELHVSTPEAPVVQRYLRQMVNAGMTHCVLETTSHGLAQHRVTAVDFDVAVVTNITHEHLDYHQSFDEYIGAKSRLFEIVAAGTPSPHKPYAVKKTAVLNMDDPAYEQLARIKTQQQFTYSLENTEADMHALKVVTDPWGTYFEIEVTSQTIPKLFDEVFIPVKSRLLGAFNVQNMLTAAAATYAMGIDHDTIQIGLQAIERVHGRMHQINRGQKFIVHVDFAHTPDALAKAIEAARGILHLTEGKGRIITVFGSAGKRDPEKRRLMAEVSTEMGNLTVLTAEDPRTESLTEILEAMAQGCRNKGGIEGQTFWRVPDRGQAIFFALTQAREKDFVLVCGKGHEQSMCFGTVEHPWDDIKATEKAIDAYLKGESMPDLGLPTFDPDFHQKFMNKGET